MRTDRLGRADERVLELGRARMGARVAGQGNGMPSQPVLFQHVLVAIDFDECSGAAVEQAVRLAESLNASITVTHAVAVPYGYISSLMGELMTQLQDRARAQLGAVIQPIRERIPNVQDVVRWGVPWEEILDVAREVHADLIVLGARGPKHVPHLLGSVAEKVVRMATVPVLTVHCSLPHEGLDELPPPERLSKARAGAPGSDDLRSRRTR
jgi:nucleotide-binding universal stress UspA family protein